MTTGWRSAGGRSKTVEVSTRARGGGRSSRRAAGHVSGAEEATGEDSRGEPRVMRAAMTQMNDRRGQQDDRQGQQDDGLSGAPPPADPLVGLRAHIDDIDQQLVALLRQRLDLSVHIGQHKAATGLALLDQGREHELVERGSAAVEPQHRDAIRRLIGHILEESKRTMAAATIGAQRGNTSPTSAPCLLLPSSDPSTNRA